MHRCKLTLVTLVLAALAAASSAQAKINPGFTPIQLVEQSGTILKVMLKATDKPLIYDIQVLEAYKQEKGAKANLKLDLAAGTFKEQAEKVAEEIKAHSGEFALLFAGEFHEQAEGGGGAQELSEGYIHIAGRWVGLYKMKDGGGFEMGKIDDHMQGTWAGGTDMLDRCMKYVRDKKAEANVPVAAEAQWERNAKIGTVPGKVTVTLPVDLGGAAVAEYSGEALFVGSDAGDKLFAWDPKAGEAKTGEMVDVTAKHKLTSKSRVAVWGDFNRDGKPDLASWDGKALTLHIQQTDGTFQAKPVDTGDALKAGVISLAVVDCGKETPGLVAGTKAGPVVLTPAGDGKFTGTLLAAPPTTQKDKSETSGQCLVADLDNDGVADIVQLFESRGAIYKGKAPGQFDKAMPSDVGLGEGVSKAWLGDYKGDGSLDIFTVAEDSCRIWQNQGGLKFADFFGMSGEISYISKPGGIDGMTCDFNSDGRQDILIIYSGMCPQLFFNRGWRSTGHAHAPIDVDETQVLPEAAKGQQAGCMGDFNGDGAQDMAFVLTNGDVYVFYRKVFEGEPALAIRACLPAKSGPVGPVTVVRYKDKMCLGAWSLTAGSASAFIGMRTPGTVHFEWKTADGKPQQRDVKILDQAVKFVVEPKK